MTDTRFSSSTTNPTHSATVTAGLPDSDVPASDAIANTSTLTNKATENALASATPPDTESASAPAIQHSVSLDHNKILKTLTSTIIQDTTSTGNGNDSDSSIIQQAGSPATAELTTLSTRTDSKIIQPAPSVGVSTPFNCTTTTDCKKQNDDVVMGNPELNSTLSAQNDEDLPPWLTQKIKYLRSVSEENAWQNVVTEFVAFEKSEPPTGVSPYRDIDFANVVSNLNIILFSSTKTMLSSSRPVQIANWIKSKKKASVPSVVPGRYGPLLTKWWKSLQPLWRAQDDGILSRDTPTNENWRLLRKGGASGIYTVIMGLSWWIKAQATERDADSWLMVDDLTFVIQQMHRISGTSSGNTTPLKRACHEEDTNEANQRPMKR